MCCRRSEVRAQRKPADPGRAGFGVLEGVQLLLL
jgi:hypothetical protein